MFGTRLQGEDIQPGITRTMSWFLFIALNAALFVRPGDLFPANEIHVYLYLILTCLLASTSELAAVINTRALSRAPITCCVLGMLPAVVLSHLVHFQFGLALACVEKLGRVVIYYLLFVSLVDTLPRLQSFLFWLNRDGNRDAIRDENLDAISIESNRLLRLPGKLIAPGIRTQWMTSP